MDIKKDILRLKSISTTSDLMRRLLDVLQDENSTYIELSEIIERDQSLAHKIVAAANAPYFGHQGRINSIEQAILLLGFDLVKSLALGMTVISGFLKKGSFEVRRMWMHAFEVAAMSSMLCRKVPVTSEGVCFLAGLMHDIGRIVFLTLYNQVYIDIVDSPQLLEREKNAFGLDHSEVSSLFLEYSNFPREIIRAVRYHHNITEVKKDKGIATTVYLAEGLSDFITPIVEGDGVWGDTEMQVFREVGLSEIDLLTIQDDMTKEGPAIEAFFNLY